MRVVILAATLLASGPVLAQAPCLKPGVPQCMEDTTTFVAADRMTACQAEVRDYVERTMDYLKCLSEEHVATGRDLTRNVERFNCRLAGNQPCN